MVLKVKRILKANIKPQLEQNFAEVLVSAIRNDGKAGMGLALLDSRFSKSLILKYFMKRKGQRKQPEKEQLQGVIDVNIGSKCQFQFCRI